MKKKGAIGIAAVAVATALAVGLGAVSSWYTNWDVKSWFNKPSKPDNEITDTVPDNPDNPDNPDTPNDDITNDVDYSGNVDMGIDGSILDVGNDGIMTVGIDSVNDCGDIYYQLTAENDGKENLIWSMSWANTTGWASDKDINDYISLSNQSSDTKQVQLRCVKPFGKQVIVKASIEDNSDIFGTITVDYGQKIIGSELVIADSMIATGHDGSDKAVVMTFSDGGSSYSIDCFMDKSDKVPVYYSTNANGGSSVTYSEAYSLKSTLRNWNVNVSFNEDLFTDSVIQNLFGCSLVDFKSKYMLGIQSFTVCSNGNFYSSEYEHPFSRYYGLTRYMFNSTNFDDEVVYKLCKYAEDIASSNSGLPAGVFKLESIASNKYSTYTENYYIRFNSSDWHKSTYVKIEDESGESSIIF